MLTPSMISAESMTPGLTDEQKLNLLLLVKYCPAYMNNLGLFPGLSDKLDQEASSPTVITQALKAVLTQLDTLPAEVVESQGDDTSNAFFATAQNWNSLAIDVLNCFYTISESLARQSYGVVQRTVDDLLLNDDLQLALKRSKVGRRY